MTDAGKATLHLAGQLREAEQHARAIAIERDAALMQIEQLMDDRRLLKQENVGLQANAMAAAEILRLRDQLQAIGIVQPTVKLIKISDTVYRVEQPSDGAPYVTTFYGPDAEREARRFAAGIGGLS